MIFLFHPAGHPQGADWQDKLKELTVPHKIIESDNSTPAIAEGDKRYEGAEAIDQFLEGYEAFMRSWNQDRCDMWFLD